MLKPITQQGQAQASSPTRILSRLTWCDDDDDDDEAVDAEVSVLRSVSFFTMSCKTAVTRCASIAVSVVGPGSASSPPRLSADDGSAGKATTSMVCLVPVNATDLKRMG